MSRRGSSTLQDRIFACLTYLVPLLEVMLFGSFLFALVPSISLLFTPFLMLLPIYFYRIGSFPVVELAVFFGLFVGVVRNESLGHFLRFNAMQALLITIALFVVRAVLDLLGIFQAPFAASGYGGNSWLALANVGLTGLLLSVLFIATVTAVIFAIVQTLRSLYAEIPVISEAAYQQTRF